MLACRNLEKAETARQEILSSASADVEHSKAAPDTVIVLQLDTSSLASVRGFVSKLKSEVLVHGKGLRRIDYLVNNAGMIPSHFELTRDGFEGTYATNVVGSFLLTSLLIPHLSTELTSSSGQHRQRHGAGRIVVVSSAGTYLSLAVTDKDLNCERTWCARYFQRRHDKKQSDSNPPRPGWSEAFGSIRSMFVYCQSKAVNSLVAYELASRLDASPLYADSGVTVACLHPGLVTSDLWRRSSQNTRNPLVWLFYRGLAAIGISTEQAALNVVYAMLAEDTRGCLLDEDRRLRMPSFIAVDGEGRRGVWERLRKDAGLKVDEGL